MTTKFIVTEKAQRPARMDGTCFYCDQKIGEMHRNDCVLVKVRIEVVASIKYETEMPAHWKKKDFEFSRNDGTWCGSNVIGEIERHKAESNGCLCGATHIQFMETKSAPYLDEG